MRPIISVQENEGLCGQVREALWPIPKNSSPGPDGFGSTFFMYSWDIVNDDLVEAGEDLFLGNSLSRFNSSLFIVLIPKVQDLKSFDKFHPISLCSVACKIFSKMLVKRLTVFLSRVISPEQGASILGRNIF